MASRGDFDKLLLEAVDEGLAVLGETTRQTFYYQLESSRSVSRDEIPDKLDNFVAFLKGTFGVGGRVIKRIIVKRLYSKVGLQFVEKANYTCADYVRAARTKYRKQKTS